MAYPVANPKVIQRARQVLSLNPLFLDTETTGTGSMDVIIEVGIVDMDGNVLYDRLVNPGRPIPAESSAVNEIMDEMVANADTWPLVWGEIEPILRGRAIGIYNAEFDMRLLKQSNQVNKLPWSLEDGQAFCMMKLFSAYYGEWNPRYNGFKSHKLEFAGKFCQIELANTHHAVDDARLTAALLRYIASR
ncbi:MAG: 3'-5' exonuclease [Anaerolineaceae bacterium]